MEDHQRGEDKERWDKLFTVGADLESLANKEGQTWRDPWSNFCVNGVT